MNRTVSQCIAMSTVSLWATVATAAPTCAEVEAFLAGKALVEQCFQSADLRTNNAQTTPANNSITTFADGSPLPAPLGTSAGSFTPTTDRSVIAIGPTPSAGPVPGIQVRGWFADDPTGQARFVLRFPDDWNGKLVVAGASGNRSEYNGDWAWSDYVLPKGYAYASQNKGQLNFYLTGLPTTPPPSDPLSCRLNPGAGSTTWVHFYANDPAKSFGEWTTYMLATAKLAQGAAKAAYKHHPQRTYAVGTSNGGYQVRRAIEEGPDLFDGGVDWEGTHIDAEGPNLLTELPVAVKNFPDYVASGYDLASPAALAILAAGYPPDIANPDNAVDTLWTRNYNSYWELTACQWQKRLDPSYATYAAGVGNYDYLSRADTVPGVLDAVADVENTGKIKKPLVTVAGTMDALLPIVSHARGYEAKIDASRKGNNAHRGAQYRLYEIQNGNHIEGWVRNTANPAGFFPQLVLLQPHAEKAFDALVAHVEANAPLPPSQCVPKGGTISATPAQPGHCAELFVP